MRCAPSESGRVIQSLLIIAIAVAAVVTCVTPASADRRSYVWSYAYLTKPPGGMELEFYLTNEIPSTNVMGQSFWEHRAELEIGLTNRWDFALYQIFNQTPEEGFHYDAFQLRTRYRLGEAGQWFVDPLLYLEYQRPSDLTAPHTLEGKLILAHDFEKVNVVVNLIEELAIAPGSEWETGYSAGISIEPHPILILGLEVFGDIAAPEEESHYAGPTISFARDRWYYTMGVALGLNSAANDVRTRALVGIDL